MRWILALLLILAACSGSQVNEPILETLTISEECTNKESCCETDCGSFCSENSQSYDKHLLNGNTCACWCN